MVLFASYCMKSEKSSKSLFHFVNQVDDTEVISFLLSTEIIPLCLRTMEMGSELSKTVSLLTYFNIFSQLYILSILLLFIFIKSQNSVKMYLCLRLYCAQLLAFQNW